MNGYPGRGAHGRTVAVLGSRIVQGDIAVGQVLDVVALEEEFDVSRTVVRESLRVLAAKGLVDARPRRGTYVLPREHWVLLDPDVLRWRFAGRGTDAAFLDHLFEMRMTVEPTVARLAALRRDDEDLAALGLAMEDMRGAVASEDPHALVDADVAFHQALLVGAHNELFAQMATVIEVGLRVRDRLVPDHITADPTEEHAPVLDAVRMRRPDVAEQAMRSLLYNSAADANAAAELRARSGDG